MGVGEWFRDFCTQLRMGSTLRASLSARTARITRQLNSDFRNTASETANRFYVGSLGRNTAIPSVSDVDLLYALPHDLYYQYNAHANNGQSALLASVRNSIKNTYSSSRVSGDGQVVVIDFTDNITYEILPAFLNKEDGYTFADANVGGTWRTCKPKQEMSAFAARDNDCNGNLVELCRMVRAWRDYNSVPISGMLIDTLCYQFIGTWAYRKESYLYFDWLSRDFFGYLAGLDPNKSYWQAPGSGSYVYKGGSFTYKARQAELRVGEAIQYEQSGHHWSAKGKYREVYGTAFPS